MYLPLKYILLKLEHILILVKAAFIKIIDEVLEYKKKTLSIESLSLETIDRLIGVILVNLGTGMQGGVIFVRQGVDGTLCSHEVILSKPDDKDMEKILVNVKKFCSIFGYDCDKIISDEFVKITPKSKRPYGNLYIPGP